MFDPTGERPLSRIVAAWVAGLAAMVVVLIWTIQQSSAATWFIGTLGALIALGGFAFLNVTGWGRLLIRTVGVGAAVLGVMTAFTVGISLLLAATILLLGSRAPKRMPSPTPLFERTRVDPRSRRFVWGGALALMILVLVVAIQEQTEGTVSAQDQPGLGALIALGVFVLLGGLALLDPMGWGRFMMRAVAVAAVALVFTGLLILYLPLFVAAAILMLSSRDPNRRPSAGSP